MTTETYPTGSDLNAARVADIEAIAAGFRAIVTLIDAMAEHQIGDQLVWLGGTTDEVMRARAQAAFLANSVRAKSGLPPIELPA